MRRVLRWDGLIPTKIQDGSPGAVTPDDIREMKAWIDQNRSARTPFHIVQEGQTPGGNRKRGAAIVRPWADAGITWWLEANWSAWRTSWFSLGSGSGIRWAFSLSFVANEGILAQRMNASRLIAHKLWVRREIVKEHRTRVVA